VYIVTLLVGIVAQSKHSVLCDIVTSYVLCVHSDFIQEVLQGTDF
jgi:hypothetical protein